MAGAFVPAVLGLALATPIYWPERAPCGEALPHGLGVLVVACPYALGLAVPLATSIGIGGLARRGCLARGGAVLESIALTRTSAFDKTSTTRLEPLLKPLAYLRNSFNLRQVFQMKGQRGRRWRGEFERADES